ncbi:OmpA family protein [Flavivirga amylovorans]|uniref:OmpA family protein n=1 Tax=Flavivirga amylovorans TaxID=870486 RepID=A0ABT8X0S9_9FLAO|nr:OmpA family protein [Flavivirga amylovorans]MDO5987477.1 OmpA family protein [Flavivirga amylovorans]
MKIKIVTLKLSLVLVLFMIYQYSPAQTENSKLIRANKKYNEYEYVNATDIYLRVVNSGYTSEEVFQKLGNTYYFNSKYEDALKWYKELMQLNANPEDPIYLLRYSQTLKALSKHKESEAVYNSFLKRIDNNDSKFSTTKSYLDIIAENSNRYAVTPASINTSESEYGSTIMNNKYIYATAQRSGSLSKTIDNWTGKYFLDLWEASYNEDGSLGKGKKMKNGLNSKYHESSLTFTKDRKTVYFTRSSNTSKTSKKKKQSSNLKIYRATKQANGDWGNIEDLSINGDSYSTAHPSLSPDEKTLYYSSNQPGGLGETDIYMVTINSNGSFNVPKNMGPSVNTKGREAFPFISKDYELYFSSDGHYGLGGYDVFYLDLKQKVLQMINVGVPINSPEDDFAFFINNTTKKGSFSSNRPGGQGADDIYLFEELKTIKEATRAILVGTVEDEDTLEPLANVLVQLKDEQNNIIDEMTTTSGGVYNFDYNRYYNHIVEANKTDYVGTNEFVKANITAKKVVRDLKLKRNISEVKDNTEITDAVDLQPIYFDFNKATIQEDSKIELMKVVAFMKEQPTVKIKVGAHTDSRGNDAYNLALSERRAKSTINFIIKQGISKNRIMGEGYGESQLKNNCTNNSNCSEEKHLLNRRSEFIIVK